LNQSQRHQVGHPENGLFYGNIQTVIKNWLLIEGHSNERYVRRLFTDEAEAARSSS